MARDEEIALWIDECWKAALEAQLKDESLKQHLQNVLDGMCRQIPEQEYDRISREIQAEEQAELERQEEGRTYTAYRVVENGEEHFFKVTPGDTFLNVGNMLRRYLRADTLQSRWLRRKLELPAQCSGEGSSALQDGRVLPAADGHEPSQLRAVLACGRGHPADDENVRETKWREMNK